MISSVCFFVCLLARLGLNKICSTDFSTEFGGNVAQGPRKKPLDFGGNPDHNYLSAMVRRDLTVIVRWATKHTRQNAPRVCVCVCVCVCVLHEVCLRE